MAILKINTVLDNLNSMYELLFEESDEADSLVPDFPVLPEKLSDFLRFHSSFVPDTNLVVLQDIAGKIKRKEDALTFISLIRSFNQKVENLKCKRSLSRYYSGNAANSEKIEEEANVRKANLFVIFSDIRGFTSISEALEPQEVAFFLKEYFEKVFKLTRSLNIRIDKIIGDAYLALTENPHSVTYFCQRIGKVLTDFNRGFKSNTGKKYVDINDKLRSKPGFEQGLHIRSGIGIHYGPLIAGDIGTKLRADHTVIGDTVNVAARLEGLTKNFMNPEDDSLILYSHEAITQIIEWIRSETNKHSRNNPKWREQLTDTLSGGRFAHTGLRLLFNAEQTYKAIREVIGFTLKGKASTIRVFTDHPISKKFSSIIKVYNEAIRRYYMGGNSLFISYQQLSSIYEKLPTDLIVSNALETVAEQLTEHFFDLARSKAKHNPHLPQENYIQGTVNMMFNNHHKAISNFISFLEFKFKDSLEEFRDYIKSAGNALLALVKKLNSDNASEYAPQIVEYKDAMEMLAGKQFMKVTDIKEYAQFLEIMRGYMDDWKNQVTDFQNEINHRLELIPIILLYSHILDFKVHEFSLYHMVLSQWEAVVLEHLNDYEKLKQYYSPRIVTAIKIANFPVNPKIQEVFKYQFFVDL